MAPSFRRYTKSVAISVAVACLSSLVAADCNSPTERPPVEVSIALSPDAVTLRPGQTQQFSVTRTLSDGSTQTGNAITWTATGGTISPNGLYVAGDTGGEYRTKATSAGGHSDSSSVTITKPVEVSIALSPGAVTLRPGQTQQFSVTRTMSDSSTQAGDSITWTATGGTIGSNGLYVAGATSGTYWAKATSAAGHSDSSKVAITKAVEVSIALSPDSVTLNAGNSQQFSVTRTLSDSSTQPGDSITWTATGGAVSSSGLYVAGSTAGTYRVKATSAAGHSDSSKVTIVAAVLDGLALTPDSVSLAPNGTVQFTATGHFSDGSSGSVSAAFSATGGTVTTTGFYTAPATAGTYRVIATVAAFADTSVVTVTSGSGGSVGYLYPLKAGPTGRYLVDQNGKPFFLVGDAPWSLIAQLSDADADTYLANRQQLGFDAIIVNLIEHEFATNAPADYYNLAPFTGAAFTSAENEAYFAHADHIIQSAAAKGIVVLLDPVYLGYDCGNQGWCADMLNASVSDMTAWGAYVGNRYKNYDNIIWLIGGDTSPDQTTAVKNRVQAVVTGILSQDTRHLFTAHNGPESMGVTPWAGASWLTINNVYSYSSTLYDQALTAYNYSPTLPFFLIESTYENEGATARQLRMQSYWTVLSGGFGHVFGNCPIWELGANVTICTGTNWQGQLNHQGSLNMSYLGKLFNSRHWEKLIPDVNHQVVTAGYSSSTDYATTAYASDSSSIIVYMPSSRAVTLSLTKLAGTTMTAWWYNPSLGTSQSAGTFSASDTPSLTPPSSGDWVLVVDSGRFGFGPPGQ